MYAEEVSNALHRWLQQDIGSVNGVEHRIKLKGGSKPIAQKLQRLGVIQSVALLTEMRKLLEAGFIYPVVAESKWVSLVVVIPKKNGKWRVCVCV